MFKNRTILNVRFENSVITYNLVLRPGPYLRSRQKWAMALGSNFWGGGKFLEPESLVFLFMILSIHIYDTSF